MSAEAYSAHYILQGELEAFLPIEYRAFSNAGVDSSLSIENIAAYACSEDRDELETMISRAYRTEHGRELSDGGLALLSTALLEAYDALRVAFKAKTGMSLNLVYQRYDDSERDYIWAVTGATMPSRGAKKYGGHIYLTSWAEEGSY